MKPSLLLIGALALATGACNRNETPSTTPAPDAATTPDASAMPATEPQPAASETAAPMADAGSNDALALGLLGAVDENEIAAAKQAKGKQVSAPVMAYAQKMETEHSDNLTKTQSLGTLAATAEVQTMKDKGKQELADLDKKSGKDYETAYVDAMVKGHTEALSLIDTRLLTLASNGPVKDHLTETRGHVAEHLAAAQKLQSKP